MLNLPGPWPNGGAFAEHGMEADELRKQIRRKDFEYTEDFLLRVLAEPRNQGEVHWAVIALRNVGTSVAIEPLKALCTHKKRDIAACAILTIASIVGQAETDFYVGALSGKWYREKGYALWAIEVTADPKALPCVLAWIKRNRSKIRNGKANFQDAQRAALYLYRLSPNHPDAMKVFEEIAADVWSLLRADGFTRLNGYEEFMDRLATA